MGHISFNVTNGAQLNLVQYQNDGCVHGNTANKAGGTINRFEIPAGDMVMLINYYRYVKENNIHCGFINPNGENQMY